MREIGLKIKIILVLSYTTIKFMRKKYITLYNLYFNFMRLEPA